MVNLFFKTYLFLKILLLIFGCAGSSLLYTACSGCGEQLCCMGSSLQSSTSEHRHQAHRLQQLWHVHGGAGAYWLQRACFSSCCMQAQWVQPTGSREWAQQLWRMGLVTPRHVESSQTRNQIHVPCMGRRILIHCATSKVH